MVRDVGECDQPVGDAFDPSVFNDPVALQTEWEPQATGSAGFRTHKLVKRHSHRMEFRSTFRAVLFISIFLIACLGLSAASVAVLMGGAPDKAVPGVLVCLLGLAFAGALTWILFLMMTPAVFDLRHGCYFKDRRKPEQTADPTRLKNYVTLDRVYALQIVKELHFIKNTGNRTLGRNWYYNYELNLVLCDGSRINVIYHGKIDALREDARTLSKFLRKPLWDATDCH